MMIKIIIHHQGGSERSVSYSALIIRSSKSIIVMMINIGVINIIRGIINIRVIIIIRLIINIREIIIMTNLKKETRGAHLVEDERVAHCHHKKWNPW